MYFFLVAQERVKEEAEAAQEIIKIEEADAAAPDGTDASRGIVIDDTSEFVRAIQFNPIATKVKAEPIEAKPSASTSQDVKMEDADEEMDEMEVEDVAIKEEDEEDEGAMLIAIEAAIKATEAAERAEADGAEADVGGTSTEQTFSTGMASTLNILRQSGILAPPSASQSEREKTQLQRDLWLAINATKSLSVSSSDYRVVVRIRTRQLENTRTAYGSNEKHGKAWKLSKITSPTSTLSTTMSSVAR